MPSGAHSARCANCGESAGPRFCPHCGQEVAPRQGPFLEVAHEVLSEWWSLDSRLVRSLRALARPGRLSGLYLDGKRAPFLRPFRLYLVASLALFSTLLSLEAPDARDLHIYIGGELVSSPAPVAGASVQMNRSLQLLRDDTLDGRWMLRLAGDRVDRLRALPQQELVDMLFGGLGRMLPLTLVAFVPFLALGLKLLYVRKRAAHSLYLDHLVFALHFQSALFFALAVVWLLAWLARVPLFVSALAYVLTGLLVLLQQI